MEKEFREITFWKDGAGRLVLRMTSADEVVLLRKAEDGKEQAVRGWFDRQGRAREFFEVRRERLLAEGWQILSF
jgi:hypothetical protein